LLDVDMPRLSTFATEKKKRKPAIRRISGMSGVACEVVGYGYTS